MLSFSCLFPFYFILFYFYFLRSPSIQAVLPFPQPTPPNPSLFFVLSSWVCVDRRSHGPIWLIWFVGFFFLAMGCGSGLRTRWVGGGGFEAKWKVKANDRDQRSKIHVPENRWSSSVGFHSFNRRFLSLFTPVIVASLLDPMALVHSIVSSFILCFFFR